MIALLGAAPAVSAPAKAAETTEAETAAEAKRHYEEGTKAFNLGEFTRAVTEFKAAYNAKPDPLLLYNIAQSFRLGGDATQALFFYRSFLRNMPDAPNRKEVEGRIRTLEKQANEQRRDQPTAGGTGAGRDTTAASGGSTIATPGATAPPPVRVGEPQVGSRSALPPSTGVPAARGTTPAAQAPAGAPTRTGAPPAYSAPPAASITAVPPPPNTEASLVTTGNSSPSEPASTPMYRRWWFWPAVGGAAVVVLIGLSAAANRPPKTTLDVWEPDMWKPVTNP